MEATATQSAWMPSRRRRLVAAAIPLGVYTLCLLQTRWWLGMRWGEVLALGLVWGPFAVVQGLWLTPFLASKQARRKKVLRLALFSLLYAIYLVCLIHLPHWPFPRR